MKLCVVAIVSPFVLSVNPLSNEGKQSTPNFFALSCAIFNFIMFWYSC